MAPIESYALLSDTQTAALVGRDGSIDWLCLPRFDSGACFAALLGGPENGRWKISPRDPVKKVRRRYLPGTLILETEFTTATGTVQLIDFMTPRDELPDLVRIVKGITGHVSLRLELELRFDYGSRVPWVRRRNGTVTAVAGTDAVALHFSTPCHGERLSTVSEFDVSAGEQRCFSMIWYPSHQDPPKPVDCLAELQHTERWWQEWSSHCTYQGPWRDEVLSSLRVLKGLTYAPTGGLVAAPTTSLPEWPGGVRNWDYRFCWLRDATFALYALMLGGYRSEAEAWREWLLRAIAGDVEQLQIMYGLGGEKRLPELELPWLPGYMQSRPVRIGNAAAEQLQLDVYGEVMDSLYQARRIGIPPDPWAWKMQLRLLDALETRWPQPDEGLWEVRGPRRHFTHSKVMAWVAFDRAVKTVEVYGETDGPLDRWKAQRDRLHLEVCERGFDRKLNAFVQSYGSDELDAALLMIPLVGFLPASDRRMQGTVRAIEEGLMSHGFVRRYATHPSGEVDGLPAGEGAFLPCTFWLADNYALMGRREEAVKLFERLLALRNDLGLLAEEYDPISERMLGNFPQAFSHLSLLNTAYNLTREQPGPAQLRPGLE
jgi:GH15 family glucan-1,4-alpha-glucosidase